MRRLGSSAAGSRRARRFTAAAALLGAAFVAGGAELAARAALAREPRVAQARRVLAGAEAPWERPRLVAHPTLAWIPNPEHPDHSPQGFRGTPVPRVPSPGRRRVVVLGPSTVYGYSVPRAALAWPARLEAALREAGEDAEVVNAGVPGYTSHEMLRAWGAKWRLWGADLAILELGGNDAAGYFRPGWSPDAGHYRRVWLGPRRLAGVRRALARESAAWGLWETLAAGPRPWVFDVFLPAGAAGPYPAWYEDPGPGPWRTLPSEAIALRWNAAALLAAVRPSGARALVVPFALSPREDLAAPMAREYGASPRDLRDAYARDRAEVLAAAAEAGAATALGWDSAIGPERWTDGCHLDAEGEEAKARALAGPALAALRGAERGA